MSLIEVVFVAGVAATIGAVAIPSMLSGLDEFRTLGAVRYVSSRLQQTRMEAVVRTANTAIRFTQVGEAYSYAVYMDGNEDGVRTLDIERGIDREIRRQERLSDQFPGVDFGAIPGLPAVDPGGAAPGSDPLRIGSSDLLSFTALGTATSGSLYIRGARSTQYVVRVLGETGRTRILRFDTKTGRWVSL
jgi:hypothetical protein